MRSCVTTIAVLFLFAIATRGQSVEILGTAKVSVMSTVTSGSSNVIRQADGTLAVRKYQIGDFAQGGIVFFVDETGEHGLVCAKADHSVAIRWYAGGLVSTQAKGDGPLAGEMNTAIAISSQAALSDDGATYAARVCAELLVTEGDYTYGDWYLPSKAELNLLQQNKAIINTTAVANGGAAFTEFVSYWSSTESSNSHAWGQQITTGVHSTTSKSITFRVRAVRAF
jgi:hypothetical protein